MATVIISEQMLWQNGLVLNICLGNKGYIHLFLNTFVSYLKLFHILTLLFFIFK